MSFFSVRRHLKLQGVSKVIAAMGGSGKSTLTRKLRAGGVRVRDSDSQRFHYLTNDAGQYIDRSGNIVTSKEARVRNPYFIRDYMEAIHEAIAQNDVVFVIPHDAVRDALISAGIEFDLVRFEPGMKQEVIERIRNRNSDQPNEIIADIVDSQWDVWMRTIDRPGPRRTFVLRPGQFLEDVILFDERSFTLEGATSAGK